MNSRFALAATLGLCLVGSLALGFLFPGGPPSGTVNKPSETIATQDQEIKFRAKTPAGQEVQGVERRHGKTTTIEIKRIDLPMDIPMEE
jgi:hypothetical protein